VIDWYWRSGNIKKGWTIDVLLEFVVLEFDITNDAIGEKWHDVCAASGGTDIQVLECDGRYIFAVVEGGAWRVFDAKCPHHGTSLGFCEIRSATVECPLHGWRFDLRSGKCTRFGTQNLHELKTKLDRSRVLALW
jgi:nitrite reductase (NADH) small subunit